MNAHSSSALVSCDVCQKHVALAETAVVDDGRVCFSCSLVPDAKPRPRDWWVGRALTAVIGVALVLLTLWELFT